MHEYVIKAVEDTLKQYGIDWILEEREDDSKGRFKDLMSEIELALGKVLD